MARRGHETEGRSDLLERLEPPRGHGRTCKSINGPCSKRQRLHVLEPFEQWKTGRVTKYKTLCPRCVHWSMQVHSLSIINRKRKIELWMRCNKVAQVCFASYMSTFPLNCFPRGGNENSFMSDFKENLRIRLLSWFALKTYRNAKNDGLTAPRSQWLCLRTQNFSDPF